MKNFQRSVTASWDVVDDVVKKTSFFQEASSIYFSILPQGEIPRRDLSSALKLLILSVGWDLKMGYHLFRPAAAATALTKNPILSDV